MQVSSRLCVSRTKLFLSARYPLGVAEFSTKKGNTKQDRKKAAGVDDKKAQTDMLVKFYHAAEKARREKITFPEAEAEEHKRIAREYNRQLFIRHNKQDHDLANKIWLQQEAINALPPHLKAHALTLDSTPTPGDRPWPLYDTPAIEGFDVSKYVGAESDSFDEGEDDEA